MNTNIREKNGQIMSQNQPDNVTRLRTPLERFRDKLGVVKGYIGCVWV